MVELVRHCRWETMVCVRHCDYAASTVHMLDRIDEESTYLACRIFRVIVIASDGAVSKLVPFFLFLL